MVFVVRRWVSTQARLAGAVGLAFVVLYVVGFFIGGTTPDYDAPDEEWTAWFDDGGNQAQATIGIVLLVLAFLLLIWFAALMSRELRLRDPRSDLRTDAASSLVTAAGTAAAVTGMVAILVAVGIAPAVAFAPDYEVPSAELLKALEQIGIAIWLIGSGWSQALFLVAVAVGAHHVRLFPRWLIILGYVAAVVLLASPLFIPMVVFPLWVIVASVLLLRQPPAAAPASTVDTVGVQ